MGLVHCFDDLCPFCCCSFATGIEFREGALLINPKCSLPAQKGMVFSVNVGFAGLSNPSAEDQAGQSYALFVGDTVLVGEVGRDLGWEGWDVGEVQLGRVGGVGYWRGAVRKDGRGGVLERWSWEGWADNFVMPALDMCGCGGRHRLEWWDVRRCREKGGMWGRCNGRVEMVERFMRSACTNTYAHIHTG